MYTLQRHIRGTLKNPTEYYAGKILGKVSWTFKQSEAVKLTNDELRELIKALTQYGSVYTYKPVKVKR